MEQAEAPTFLDVPALLESSEPRPRVAWFWIIMSAIAIVALCRSGAPSDPPAAHHVIQALAGLVIAGLLVLRVVLTMIAGRTARAEQQAIEGIGELVQLRRWPQAAFMIEQILSQPARTNRLRIQALVYLAAVLNRYHRFEEAISVHNHLLDEEPVDEGSAYALKFARAMSMLREDHLFDADRAISELRRSPGASDSAALALVEIYRDVKTGHPDDALRIFEDRLPMIRDQFGHRMADSYALAARAYDLQGREAEAADAWRRATLLAPASELSRRYPEVQKLLDRYAAAPAPREMA